MTELRSHITQQYRERFGREDLLVRSPGRVNLIGEHTDYNDGFVLPCAIDRHIVMALGARHDNAIHLISTDQNNSVVLNIDETVVLTDPTDIERVRNELKGMFPSL